MMRALILLHRWLGIASCLLFAMWFATGIVMHFVPFPAPQESERFAGLAPLDISSVEHGPGEAIAAAGISDAARVRLLRRSDGPVYLIAGSVRKALRADDLAEATVPSERLALAIAIDYARRRHLASSVAQAERLESHDQWTVSGAYDRHRPLFRIALGDNLGTELYVSSTTGEVVLTTTRRERQWNYVGSVAHWIYPTALRSHPSAWSVLVRWLSFLALIGALSGSLVGILRIKSYGPRPLLPYSGLQAWHHGLGLTCMLFVLTWIFSGWLAMDSGQLFSTGGLTAAETRAVSGSPDWNTVSTDELQRVSPGAKEVEWFAFGGRIYRRDRLAADRQQLAVAAARSDIAASANALLSAAEVNAIAGRLGPTCNPAVAVAFADAYAPAPSLPGAPIFRLICGDDWYEIDGASGQLLEKLDPSRRAYRWLYGALHTFDVPALVARPALRTALIVGLCGCGFVFSLTGVVLAWRRLRSCTPA
jgi:hypothetical protein